MLIPRLTFENFTHSILLCPPQVYTHLNFAVTLKHSLMTATIKFVGRHYYVADHQLDIIAGIDGVEEKLGAFLKS